MVESKETVPLYEQYTKQLPFKTLGQAEARITELHEHIIRLEVDAEDEFFERIGILENKVDALESRHAIIG